MSDVAKTAKIFFEGKVPKIRMEGIWTAGDVSRAYNGLLRARKEAILKYVRKERMKEGE